MQAVLKQANQVRPTDGHQYIPKSLQDLQQAITAGEKVLKNPLADQTMIDQVTVALIKTMEDLQEEPLVTDKSALQAILAKANAVEPMKGREYTPATKTRLDEAIEIGEAVVADVNARQEQIDIAEATVKTALEGLEEQAIKADKIKLNELIQEAESLKPKTGNQFTQKTQRVLIEAIKQAKAVADNTSVTQEEVDQSLATLSQAIKAMKEETTTTHGSTDTGMSGAIDQGNGATGGTRTKIYTTGKLPKTNEVVTSFLGISGLLLILSAGFGKLFFKNKKKRN